MAKIIYERQKCISCGSCLAICSKYWEMSDNGKIKLIGSKLNSKSGNYELDIGEVECNQNAAELCPVQCIKIIK